MGGQSNALVTDDDDECKSWGCTDAAAVAACKLV